jgi:hypothetical protein
MKGLCAALSTGLAAVGLAACGTETAVDPPHRHARAVRAAEPCYWGSPDGHVYVQFVPGPHVPRGAICGQAQPYLSWPGDGGKIWPEASALPAKKYVTVCTVTSPYGNWTVVSEAQQDAQAHAACSFVRSSRLP